MTEAIHPDIQEILNRNYMRVLLRNTDKSYTARVLEFPGVLSEGSTADEAIDNLDEAIAAVVEVMLDDGVRVPDPLEEREYSGKLVLRIPPSLHRAVALQSQIDGISINRLLSNAVAAALAAQTGREEPSVHYAPRGNSVPQIQRKIPLDAKYRSPDVDAVAPNLINLWAALSEEKQSSVTRWCMEQFRPFPGADVVVLTNDKSPGNQLRVLWRALSPEERFKLEELINVSVASDFR